MTELFSGSRGIGGEYGRKDVSVKKIFTLSGVTIFEPGKGAYHFPMVDFGHPVHITEAGMDCLHFLAQGMSNKEIAASRSTPGNTVTEQTIKNQLTGGLFPKLEANDRTHAVMLGLRKGFLTMDDLVDRSPFPLRSGEPVS